MANYVTTIELQRDETVKRALYNDIINAGYFIPKFNDNALTVESMLASRDVKRFVLFHSRDLQRSIIDGENLNSHADLAYKTIQAHLLRTTGRVEFIRVILHHIDPENKYRLAKLKFDITSEKFLVDQDGIKYEWSPDPNSIQQMYNKFFNRYQKILNTKIYHDCLVKEKELERAEFDARLKKMISKMTPEMAYQIQDLDSYQRYSQNVNYQALADSFFRKEQVEIYKRALSTKDPIELLRCRLIAAGVNSLASKSKIKKLSIFFEESPSEARASLVGKQLDSLIRPEVNMQYPPQEEMERQSQMSAASYDINNDDSLDDIPVLPQFFEQNANLLVTSEHNSVKTEQKSGNNQNMAAGDQNNIQDTRLNPATNSNPQQKPQSSVNAQNTVFNVPYQPPRISQSIKVSEIQAPQTSLNVPGNDTSNAFLVNSSRISPPQNQQNDLTPQNTPKPDAGPQRNEAPNSGDHVMKEESPPSRTDAAEQEQRDRIYAEMIARDERHAQGNYTNSIIQGNVGSRTVAPPKNTSFPVENAQLRPGTVINNNQNITVFGSNRQQLPSVTPNPGNRQAPPPFNFNRQTRNNPQFLHQMTIEDNRMQYFADVTRPTPEEADIYYQWAIQNLSENELKAELNYLEAAGVIFGDDNHQNTDDERTNQTAIDQQKRGNDSRGA